MTHGGEITQAVQALVLRARGGLISADEFKSKCDQALRHLDRLFEEIQATIVLDPKGTKPRLFQEEIKAYRRQRAGQVKGIQILLEAGINELMLFFDDRFEGHLTSGIYLIQRGEADLAALQEFLKTQTDFPLSCLEVGGDLLGVLAEKVLAGEVSHDDYAELVDSFAIETLEFLRSGQERFLEAVNLIRSFDGSNFQDLLTAADGLQAASQRWLSAASNCQESAQPELASAE